MRMEKWKRIAAGALSICIIATCAPSLAELGGILQAPVTVYAETSDVIVTGNCGKTATWNYNRTTKVMTISGTGFASYCKGFSRYRKEIKKLVFSDTITGIGNAAFQNCTALEDIQFGGVKAIRIYAFEGCTALKSLNLNGNIKRIRTSAFKGCTSLESVNLGGNLTEIGVEAFADCKNLTSVTVGPKVKTVYQDIFKGCDKLTSITLNKNNTYLYADGKKLLISKFSGTCGKNVKTINNFYYSISAEKLDTMQISSKNKYYYEAKGSLISKANDELLFCFKIDGDTYTIPDSVKKIGNYAFGTQRNLKTLILSDNIIEQKSSHFLLNFYDNDDPIIEKIHLGKNYNGSITFLTNYNLKEITVSSENPNYTSINGVLYDKDAKELLCCSDALETYTIPDSVTSINDNFSYYGKLKNLTISDTITDATDWLTRFYATESLHIGKNVSKLKIDLPCLKYISADEENSTFKVINNMLYSKDGSKLLLCPAQTEGKVVLEEGVTEISGYAFQYCEGITDIIIPDTVSNIQENAFKSLDYIVIWVPKGKMDYYKSLFTKQTGFTSNMVIKELEN